MIVATLASLSTREHLLEKTIATLEHQVDAICVYLNGYEVVPQCLIRPKVLHAVLSKEAGWRGAEGKLWFWDRDQFKASPTWSDDDIAIVVDDDILYPPDYVERMVATLDAHPGSIACVHGSIMTEPFVRYAESRLVARARGPLTADARVHIPGTGTMAFRRGTLDVSIDRDVTWSHCVDVMIAIAAKRQGVPIWSVERPDGWLQPMALPRGTSIYKQRTGAGNDETETRVLLDAGPWESLEGRTPGLVARASIGGPLRGHKPRQNPNAMLPPEVAPWLAAHLQGRPSGFVVELGSGHGTAAVLAALPVGMRLLSVEHDRRWVGVVPGTTYVHAPIVGDWFDPKVLAAYLPPVDQIAAVIIDGPPKAIGRAGVLAHLEMFGGAPLILDDVQRPEEMRLAKDLAARRGTTAAIHVCNNERKFASIGWPA